MSKLVWDEPGTRLFETGVSQGILFLMKPNGTYYEGHAWNGLTAVNEAPGGGESTPIYADNFIYGRVVSEEIYTATIEAYAYPEEFMKCLGKLEVTAGVTLAQQRRRRFGFCYKTEIGNDIVGQHRSYKLHLIYNCFSSDPDTTASTISDSPDPILFSWEIQSDKVLVDDYKPTATVILDELEFSRAGMANVFSTIEKLVLGTDTSDSVLPSLQTILDLQASARYLKDSSDINILDDRGEFIETYSKL